MLESVEIGYFHGRFQPFHYGHLSVVKIALKKCPILALGISNPFRAQPVMDSFLKLEERNSLIIARESNNNPWPYWARIMMIREGLIKEDIDVSKIIFLPNLNNTGLPQEEIRFPKQITTIFLCPKDQHNLGKYREYIEEGWRVIKVPYSINISSRDIREKINLNDSSWEQYCPSGTVDVIKYLQKEFEYCFPFSSQTKENLTDSSH